MAPGLKGNLMKASLVGATGAVLSVIALGGMQSVPVLGGRFLPKALVHGIVLTGSSVAATYVAPLAVPFTSAGSPQLQKFQLLVLEPLLLGSAFLISESILAPAAESQGAGGTFREVLVGASASIAAAYVSEGLGLIPTVLG